MKPPGKYVDHPQELVILLNKLYFTMEDGIRHDLTINYYDFLGVNHHLFKCLNHQKWTYHPEIVVEILLKLNPIPLNTVYQASKILGPILGPELLTHTHRSYTPKSKHGSHGSLNLRPFPLEAHLPEPILGAIN